MYSLWHEETRRFLIGVSRTKTYHGLWKLDSSLEFASEHDIVNRERGTSISTTLSKRVNKF